MVKFVANCSREKFACRKNESISVFSCLAVNHIRGYIKVFNLIAVYNLNDVVKTTCLLADVNDFAAFNAVYAEYFSENKPARACFGGNDIPKGALVEADVIAVK